MLHTGLYHYCLSCSYKEHTIVLKRLFILDCFVRPYNHIILKAFQNKIEFMPLYTVNQWWTFKDKYEESLPDVHDTPVQDLLLNHRVVPLAELYALSDPRKIRDINAVQTEYVSTYMKTKCKFKKILTSTDDSYVLEGCGYFQKVFSNVLRHKGRTNGDALLLVETCLW